MMRKRWLQTGGLALALLIPCGPSAHQFWIEPSAFRVAPSSSVSFDLRVGDGFPGESYPRNPDHALRFEAVGPDGHETLLGDVGRSPAGAAFWTEPGLYQIVYRSSGTTTTIDAETFERYLEQEGLDEARTLRHARGRRDQPARERFSRCAKTFVRVGDAAGSRRASQEPATDDPERNDDSQSAVGSGWQLRAELTLELTPLRSLEGLRPGDSIPFLLSWQGRPRAGALVVAFRRGSGATHVASPAPTPRGAAG